MSIHHTLSFTGNFVPGYDPRDVQVRFQKLCRLNAEQGASFFRGGAVILKRNMPSDLATRYVKELEKIGMVILVDPPLPVADAQSTTPTTIEPDSATPPPLNTIAMPTSATKTAPPRTIGFTFHGKGGEFFRIWIVNLLLTVVTLGIYSAWAKVRTNRYFYASTHLDGAGFDYLANPRDILKGRLIAVLLVMIYSIGGKLHPYIGIVFGLLFMVITPWLIVRSMAFRARNSAWRNVRFRFTGKTGEAWLAYFLWPVLGFFTLGLLYPRAIYKQNNFLVGRSLFGTAPFKFNALPGAYFWPLALGGLALLGGLGIGAFCFVLSRPLAIMIMAFVSLAAFAYFKVTLANLRLNNMCLGPHRFQSDWQFGSYVRLAFGNTLLLLLTLGFFYPWAKIRTASYAAEHTRLVATDYLDNFAAGELEKGNAIGEETAEFFDVDFGF